ncbi:PREDICTED: HVA22-like protein k isoform X1 [Ipomoea nil]|uniref:HVA22-like protein k isoform X1 n=1 Tax=Ipomoea nil TaxID=35883 RepID=UPI000901AA81|nr:PREDICTED: HVA22-like protein k isoform X1 [Ipomoea nil]
MNSEVGLRLLLCPLGSNIVVRTASCSVGVVLPVYSTFKAIERRDHDEQKKWLMYWAAYGSFSMVELFTDKLLNWFPLYYHTKLAFLVWLQLPSIDGAKQVYMNHLRPFLLDHQAKLDRMVGFVYGEMSRFVSQHEEEVMFVKTILMKILAASKEVNTRPEQRQSSAAIEGPNVEDESDSEDDELMIE